MPRSPPARRRWPRRRRRHHIFSNGRVMQLRKGRESGRNASDLHQSARLSRLAKVADAANYLQEYPYLPNLRYADALRDGLPIATGVVEAVEGACCYLVEDRMNRTGARWFLHGVESALQLRAIVPSNDFGDTSCGLNSVRAPEAPVHRGLQNTIADRRTGSPARVRTN
jgi:hypothetical protein